MKLLMFFLLFSDPNEFPLFPLSSLCHASEAAQIFNDEKGKTSNNFKGKQADSTECKSIGSMRTGICVYVHTRTCVSKCMHWV